MGDRRLLTRIIPCFIILLLAAHVAAIPPMPTEFYGSVVIDGKPALIGTTISAQINGVEKGTIKTAVDGFYGGPGIFDDRLKANVTEDEYKPGELKIVFLINGQKTAQIVDFEPGISKQLRSLNRGGDCRCTATVGKYNSCRHHDTTSDISPGESNQ